MPLCIICRLLVHLHSIDLIPIKCLHLLLLLLRLLFLFWKIISTAIFLSILIAEKSIAFITCVNSMEKWLNCVFVCSAFNILGNLIIGCIWCENWKLKIMSAQIFASVSVCVCVSASATTFAHVNSMKIYKLIEKKRLETHSYVHDVSSNFLVMKWAARVLGFVFHIP